MYSILFAPKAEEFLKKLDRKSQEIIVSRLERIKIRPEHFVERLVGEEGYKLRAGDYRIFLDIIKDNLVILVLEIGQRKNVYKR